MGRRVILVALMAALAGSACDQVGTGVPEEPRAVSGFWAGRVDQGRIELLLAEDSLGNVRGSGALRGTTSASRAFEIEGVNVFPAISLTLRTGVSPSGFATGLINLRATFRGEGILRGRLNGGGFDDERVILSREDPALLR